MRCTCALPPRPPRRGLVERQANPVSQATAREATRSVSSACAEGVARCQGRQCACVRDESPALPNMTPWKIRHPQELSVHTHLVDAEVSIGVKVVIFGRHVLSVGLLAAFCLATGDLGGGEWEQTGSHLGAPQRFGSLQAGLRPHGVYRTTPQTVPWQPYSPHLPSCLAQEPPTPRAPSRRAPPIPQPGLPSLQSVCPRL